MSLYQLESLALPFESYQLAYTQTLVDNIFGTRVTEDMMLEGKFTHMEGMAAGGFVREPHNLST